MQTTTITLRIVSSAPAETGGPRLDVGAALVARVVSAPQSGGRGLIALAGMLLEARLPAGLAAGQTLHLRVTRADVHELVVRIQTAADDEHDQKAAAQLAGELALRGDGELLRVALGLAGGPLWLPGGAAATITVEPEAEDDGAGQDGSGGEAAFTLHCPQLGAVEVRLRLGPAGVRAGVITSPGHLTQIAEATLPDLVAGLERATGRPAAATLVPRSGSDPVPTPPGGAFDGYA